MAKLLPSIERVSGFQAAGVHAGLKAESALDMALIASDRHCTCAGLFTQNVFKAAPVLVNQEHLATAAERIRAVVINTVSANAGTGRAGLENSRTMARLAAEQIGCQPEQVLVMSTGVIGTHLPMQAIERGIALAREQLGQHWQQAATAMMTTDAHPKLASRRVLSPNGQYTVAGVAKGAGMIAPNMATMLSVIVTDARLSVVQAQELLKGAADASFNRIVVDGDTSTNDMVVLLGNGASGVSLDNETDVALFQQALTEVSSKLAKDIVRDGEGATKFITIEVFGAATDAAAHTIANTIAASALVKTAFYGNDANWGRIIAAAGRAGVALDAEQMALWMSPGEQRIDEERGLLLFKNGAKARYKEQDATAIISEEAVYVSLKVGTGSGHAVVYTCDLSHEYVSINADYRS